MARTGRPRIRPHPTDPGIIDRITEGLVAGMSLKDVCAQPDMPDMSMVYRECAKNPDFASSITRARELQQDAIIDEITHMADMATPEDVNVVKLQIWARQWRAAKLAPKKYGEKQHVEHSVNEDLAQRIAASRGRSGIED